MQPSVPSSQTSNRWDFIKESDFYKALEKKDYACAIIFGLGTVIGSAEILRRYKITTLPIVAALSVISIATVGYVFKYRIHSYFAEEAAKEIDQLRQKVHIVSIENKNVDSIINLTDKILNNPSYNHLKLRQLSELKNLRDEFISIFGEDKDPPTEEELKTAKNCFIENLNTIHKKLSNQQMTVLA